MSQKICGENGIWRIHDFKSNKKSYILEYIDEIESHNCPLTEWFKDNYYILSSDNKFKKNKDYSFNDIKKYIKNHNYNEDLKLAIFNQSKFRFQNDMDIKKSNKSILNNKERQILANKTQIIKDYKDCKEKKNYCYDFDNIDSIKRLYNFLNIKNKKDIIVNNLHKKYPIIIDIIQLEIDIGNITNDDIKLDGLKKEFKLLQKEIKTTINNILNLKDDYNDYLESKLTNMEIQLYLDYIDDSTIGDKNDNYAKYDHKMNVWDIYGEDTIFSSFKNNQEFKRCIDEKMTKNSNKYYDKIEYDNFMKSIENSNDNFLDIMDEDDINMIENICKSFEELTPFDIMDCLEKINIDPILTKKICNGSIILQSVDVLLIVLTFFGIHINSDNINDKNVEKVEDLVGRITPYVQKILRKILDMGEYFESNHCDNGVSNTTKVLKKFYHTLFDTKKSISYPFSDYKIKWKWFKDFNNPIGKVILLVFVAFIFAQIVKLFTMKGEALQK